MTDNDDDDINREARKIVEETRSMGGSFEAAPPKGQKCEREGCDRDAVRGPGDKWLCKKHQQKFFKKRHG
ncbi:hypothetical protein [Haloarchaeobius sp. TZWSO28]|uniref:hypothetical protein n=1 Tax=Haloarchaeobius sp. TZWSO28 TaxID=3446119 RepID=UPI003EC01722